jgi:hypothetical protein
VPVAIPAAPTYFGDGSQAGNAHARAPKLQLPHPDSDTEVGPKVATLEDHQGCECVRMQNLCHSGSLQRWRVDIEHLRGHLQASKLPCQVACRLCKSSRLQARAPGVRVDMLLVSVINLNALIEHTQ